MISSWGNYIFDRIELSYALFDTLQSNIYTRDKFQNRIQKNTNIGVIVRRFVNNFPCCKSFLISPKDIFESVYWKYYSLNCIITKYNIDNKVQSSTWTHLSFFDLSFLIKIIVYIAAVGPAFSVTISSPIFQFYSYKWKKMNFTYHN